MPHAEAHLCSRSLPRSCGLPDASTERGHCYRCRCWCGCRRPSWCRCRRRCWGRRNCTRWAPEPGLLLRPEPARAACLQPLRSTAGKALCVNESPAARRAFAAPLLAGCRRPIRFARDLMVQEVGYPMLKERAIELIAADSPHSFIARTRQPPGSSARCSGPSPSSTRP